MTTPLARLVQVHKAIGHPIRLAMEDVDRHLTGFDAVLRKELSRDEGRDPRLHYATLIYAGTKRADQPVG